MRKHHFTLFLIGAALSIAQFIMIRYFVSILYGEEVVIVLVTASLPCPGTDPSAICWYRIGLSSV